MTATTARRRDVRRTGRHAVSTRVPTRLIAAALLLTAAMVGLGVGHATAYQGQGAVAHHAP